jgi:hypothetical protein
MAPAILPKFGPNLIGQRFGRLRVIGYEGKNKRLNSLWACARDCGETRVLTTGQLRSGHTRSCGCSKQDWAKTGGQNRRHGKARSREYQIWAGMIRRCTDPKSHAYANHGGRGIHVCQRWRESFAAFLEDVGTRPSLLHSLDRFPDPDGDHEPGNVRWATTKEQDLDRRGNLILEMNEERLTLAEWSERVGIGATTISNRLQKGWTVEEALTTPTARQRRLAAGSEGLPDGEEAIADLQRQFAGMRDRLAVLVGEQESRRLLKAAWSRFIAE